MVCAHAWCARMHARTHARCARTHAHMHALQPIAPQCHTRTHGVHTRCTHARTHARAHARARSVHTHTPCACAPHRTTPHHTAPHRTAPHGVYTRTHKHRWAWDYDTLTTFAKNDAGETLPRPLLEKMINGNRFGRGINTLDQLYLAECFLCFPRSCAAWNRSTMERLPHSRLCRVFLFHTQIRCV